MDGPVRLRLALFQRLQRAVLIEGTTTDSTSPPRVITLLGNPLVVPAYPRYLSGFVHALEPVPALTDFVVEAVSNAFGRLPDPVLLPWLPTLIAVLRSGGAESAPLLIREAGRIFPGRLSALDEWVPPWRVRPEPETLNTARSTGAGQGTALLAAHPATCDAVASLLGIGQDSR